MLRRCSAVVMTAAATCAVLAAPASARWYGSTFRQTPNATYGCEAATVLGPISGIELRPTNRSSCTYSHGGYLNSNRSGFIVPGTGRVTRIRVKSGRNPAKLRLTVLTGSSRVDPFTGRDQPGTYTCCTARYIGRAFRPRPNAITTKKVNVRVEDVRERSVQIRIHSSDGLALSAEGPGTLPLHIGQSVGGYAAGTPIARSFFPRTRKGDPRVDGYSITGIDLLFQWNWRRR